MKDLIKKTFIAGLLTFLPIAGTLWLLKIIIDTAEKFFQGFLPHAWRPAQLIGYEIPGLGILVALTVVFVVGLFTRFYIGRRLLHYGDRLFHKIPLGRGIYSGIKQFLSTIAGAGKKSFRQVVIVEYPAPKIYALGFLTGEASGEVQIKTQENVYNVFLPTTPNPTSGFLLMYPKEKIIFLEMNVEDAFKFIMSGGVVVRKYSQTEEAVTSPTAQDFELRP